MAIPACCSGKTDARQIHLWGQVIEGMEAIDKVKRGEPVKDPDSIVSIKLASAA